MAARRLVAFKHASTLGNAPAHALFDFVSVTRANGADEPARRFGDYRINVEFTAVPAGVEVLEML